MRNANRVAHRLSEVISASPDLPALIGVGRSETVDPTAHRTVIDYRELSTVLEAGRLALGVAGLPSSAPVAVRVDASAESFIRMLTVLSSSHPVVPIDHAVPPERAQSIIDAAGASAHPDHPELDDAPVLRPLPGCASLLFTSGSTGSPKAVRQGHQLWDNQITDLSAELGIGPGTRVALGLPASFGGGLDIALTSIATGAALILLDPRTSGIGGLTSGLIESSPESLHLSPALLRALLAHHDAARALRSVELISTCGDAVYARDLDTLRATAPHVTFVNRSGSSETGNLAFNTFGPTDPRPDGPLPAGRAALGKTILIVDDDGRDITATGEVGEIIVRSAHLAQGYLVDGDAIDLPQVTPGLYEHRIGDRGRVRHGELMLAGRTDDTVKVRGYRVDIGEVTSVARSVDGIADAVVIARDVGHGTELVAYLQVASGARAPSTAAVRGDLARRLPLWMQPAHCILLDELPRTERGKLDRSALPAPARRPEYRAPATTSEKLLVPVWSDVLHVDEIGCDDDFFALGGDSLTALRLIDQIEDSFGITLSPSDLLSAPTLGAVAGVLDRARSSTMGKRRGVVVHFDDTNGTDDRPTVFAFAGAGESALAFAPLVRRLDSLHWIGLQARGLESPALPHWRVEAAARHFVGHVRRLCPDGPYRFVGHSLGGLLAIETARILQAQGAVVDHVVCLDTIFTGPLSTRSTFAFGGGGAQPSHVPDPVADEDMSLTPSRWELWRTRAALVSAGWWPRPADTQWSLFHELGRRSSLLHRLRRWDGPVTAVLAEDNPDSPEWWYDFAPDCAGVHRVGGDHNGMLRAPHVDRTAEVIASVWEADTR